ncbi:MAG: hypothetical protein ISQ88_03560 [Rhodobacteraceae bacterium]|nr:hypothetical protein [Paracoccaceae bacterium]
MALRAAHHPEALQRMRHKHVLELATPLYSGWSDRYFNLSYLKLLITKTTTLNNQVLGPWILVELVMLSL